MSVSPPSAGFLAQRRRAVSHSLEVQGLAHVAVTRTGAIRWDLRLHFVPKHAGSEGMGAIPPDVNASNIRLVAQGDRTPANLDVEAIRYPPAGGHVLTVAVCMVDPSGSALGVQALPTYELELVDLPQIDPFFRRSPFSLDAGTGGGYQPFPAQAATPATSQAHS